MFETSGRGTINERETVKQIIIYLIKGYVFLISPLLGKNCRFHPTCSAYAMQAVETHGVMRGGWLALWRILRCHPLYRGEAVDPVPERIAPAPMIGYKRKRSRINKQNNVG